MTAEQREEIQAVEMNKKPSLVGREVYYVEDGDVDLVLVLEDTSDEKAINIKIRQVRSISHVHYKSLATGTETDLFRKRGFGYGGMWTLRDEPRGEPLDL